MMPEKDNESTVSEERPNPQPPPRPETFWQTFPKKMAIDALLLSKEIYRKKLRWFDLSRANYRLGEKVYERQLALPKHSAVIDRLNKIQNGIEELHQPVNSGSSFKERAKAVAKGGARFMKHRILKFRRARAFRVLGAQTPEEPPFHASLAKEIEGAMLVSDRIRNVDAEIEELRRNSWTKHPFLIVVTLLIITGVVLAWSGATAARSTPGEAEAKDLWAAELARIQQDQKEEDARYERERQAQFAEANLLQQEAAERLRASQEKEKRDQEERDRAKQAKADAELKQREDVARQKDERRTTAEAKQKKQEEEFLTHRPKTPTAAYVPTTSEKPAEAAQIILNAIPLGPAVEENKTLVSKDGSRTFLVAPAGSRVQAWVDGHAGPECRNVRWEQRDDAYRKALHAKPPFSPDNERVAYITELDGGKEAVVIDATQSPIYDKVPFLAFGPKGHHVAYIAIQKDAPGGQPGHPRGRGLFLVDNGKAGPVFDDIGGFSSPNNPSFESIVFSADGEHLAYIASKKARRRVVVDGREEPKTYESIADLRVSADGKHIAYVVGTGVTRNQVVIDGIEGKRYSNLETLVLSADGSRCAYVARGTTVDEPSFVVDNNKEGAPYRKVTDLYVSAAGERLVYVGLQGANKSEYVMVDNGTPSHPYDRIYQVELSPDGKTLSFVADAAQGKLLVVNGREFGPFERIDTKLCLSADGQHWAIGVNPPRTQWSVLINGKVQTSPIKYGNITLTFTRNNRLLVQGFDSTKTEAVFLDSAGAEKEKDVPSAIVLSANEQHAATISSGHKKSVTIDGRPLGGESYSQVSNLRLSDDGKHVAYVGTYSGESTKALTHANLNGTAGPVFHNINALALSPDGTHVAYVAQEQYGSSKPQFVVVDGLKSSPFQKVLVPGYYQKSECLKFLPDGSLTFLAQNEGQLWRCTYSGDALKSIPSLAQAQAVQPGIRVLQKFGNFDDVARDLVLGPDETLYGVMRRGGEHGSGALFSCKTDGGDQKILHSFYGAGESGPSIWLAGDQQNVWGLSGSSVFRYDIKKGEYAVVSSAHRLAGLRAILPDGSLLGEQSNGSNDFHWWMLSQDGSTLDKTGDLGSWQNIVALGPDGAFYYTKSDSLYRQRSFWSEPQLLHKFIDSPEEGNGLVSKITFDPQGVIYGFSNGQAGRSMVYRINRDGSDFRVILPQARAVKVINLVSGDDGMIYGCFSAEKKTADTQTEGFFSFPADGGELKFLADVSDGTDRPLIYHKAAIYYTTDRSVLRVQCPSATGTARQTPVVTINIVPPAPLRGEQVTFSAPYIGSHGAP